MEQHVLKHVEAEHIIDWHTHHMIIQDVQQKILQAADQHVIQEVAVIQPKIITVDHGHGQHVPNLVEVEQNMNTVPAQKDQHTIIQQHVREQLLKLKVLELHVILKLVAQKPKIITADHGHGLVVQHHVVVELDIKDVPAQRDQHMTTQQHVQEQQPKNDTKILHVTLKAVIHAEVIVFIMVADLTVTQFATT